MNRITPAVFITALCLAGPVAAQDIAAAEGDTPETLEGAVLGVLDIWRDEPTTISDARDVTLADLEFVARPLIVFANSPNDPLFTQQMEYLAADPSGLAVRDVIVLVDTDPAGGSDARARLRPRGFSLVLMDKDGSIAQRKPAPWEVREIGRAIDKMPMRQQEINAGG